MKKRVADILIETLIELGVSRNFCVVGGGAMHLNNAFAIHNQIETIFCHHEQSCAFAAEGYAKLTGNIASVCVTSGPGAANTLNAVYSAWVDSTPMFVIAGHPRYNTTIESCGLNLRCRGVQELDVVSMVKGITKYAVLLKNPTDAKRMVYEAYYAAMTGRKGPVWISVPLDVQASIIEEDDCVEYIAPVCEDRSGIEFKHIVEMLRSAKRPVILTGTGIRYANAMDSFYKLTEVLSIPIVGGALLSDTLPEDYPLYYGMSGNIGPRAGNYILQNSDCILVLGNSLSTRQTGFNTDGFAPNAKIIMVDVSADEMEKPGLNIDVKVIADLRSFIPELIRNFESKGIRANQKWIDFCEKICLFFREYDDAKFEDEGRIPAKHFWKIFRENIPDNAVLALGNSNCVIGIYQYGLKKKEQRILTNYNAGSMGYDLPEAIGAAAGTNAPIICVTGDGSIMMNLQELQTIKYNRLPIKIVIFSNKGYGAIRQTCKNYFKGTYTGCDEKSGVSFPSFKEVANAFGFDYIHCTRCADINDKVIELIDSNMNSVLEVDQLYDDPVNPKIMSRMNPDGTFETPMFTDLSPYLTEEEQLYINELERSLKENV